MTKNYAKKRAAKALQLANPGTTRPAAMRAVDHSAPAATRTWRRGSTPWMRTPANQPSECYFCGHHTAIRSFGDHPTDNGRLSAYCENSDCAAREYEIIVVDDNTTATRNRSDVRILAHFGPVTDRPTWNIRSDQDWAAGTAPHVRRNPSPTVCLFCGEHTNQLAAGDTAADHGRIRLHCTNPRCAVVDAEVLVLRDATMATATRRDIDALSDLEPVNFGRPKTEPGQMRIESFQELRDREARFDAFKLRSSGPVPWQQD